MPHLFAHHLTSLHRQTFLVHCLYFPSMPSPNFHKPPSQHFSQVRLYVMSTAQLEIFFHVLVYSCQPIVASVRFKVPQVVVSSQSAVLSKIWTNWFNRANDWIGAIKAIALQRLFARVTIKTWQKPETALEKSQAHLFWTVKCLIQ